MHIVELLVAVWAVLAILFFLVYLVGLSHFPTGSRPSTPTMDRLGRPLPPSENPGYRETEDEERR